MPDGAMRTQLRKAVMPERLSISNDRIRGMVYLGPPRKLLDEFWREGELALLFGAPGVGKSVFAVQMAEAIARGREPDGFTISAGRQRVLPVDLKLTDQQFINRYSIASDESPNSFTPYDFSKNLTRKRPAQLDKFCEWLRGTVTEKRIRVVIIDDLAELRDSYDGTREMLKLIRRLRRLKDELDISILILAGSREAGRSGLVAEPDMGRSRVLCDVADSVFALGVHPSHPADRYLVQTRSRGSAIVWTESNSPTCRMMQFDDGLLGFRFDERFVPEIDKELGLLICTIRSMHDRGSTYREIAELLKISKAKAARLNKKWTPVLERSVGFVHPLDPDIAAEPETNAEYNFAEEKYAGEFTDNYLDSIGMARPPEQRSEAGQGSISSNDNAVGSDHQAGSLDDARNEDGPTWVEVNHQRIYLHSPDRVTARDTIDPMSSLKRSLDNNGREIFIEKEDGRGKPIVFYRYGSKNQLFRFERDAYGISGRPVDGPICLFNTS